MHDFWRTGSYRLENQKPARKADFDQNTAGHCLYLYTNMYNGVMSRNMWITFIAE